MSRDDRLPIYQQTCDHQLYDPQEEHPVRHDDYYDDEPVPASRDVYDPDLGADGGGRHAGSALASIDPDYPVENVNELTRIGGVRNLDREFGQGPLDHDVVDEPAQLVACPTCGSGVHPDRIRD